MPRFDGTGPEGKGPRTGRGLGNCPPIVPQTKSEGDDPVPVFGRGWGMGRGRRGRFGRGHQ